MRFPIRAAVLSCLGLTACGSEPQTGPTTVVGPVDLSKAPATVDMTCDGAIGAVTLELPCLVGLDLRARGEMVPGIHATECRLAGTGTPIAWSLLLPMGQVAAEEKVVLHIPDEAPTVPTDAGPVALGSQRATFSSVLGTLSFSRIDPDGRAFAGTLDAKVFWKATSGAGITCDLEGPLWGAPGDFL